MTERKTMQQWREEFRLRGCEDGRQAVRDRCRTILEHPAADADYEEAKRLALETDLSADEAIERLQARQADAVIERAREITEARGGK